MYADFSLPLFPSCYIVGNFGILYLFYLFVYQLILISKLNLSSSGE